MTTGSAQIYAQSPQDTQLAVSADERNYASWMHLSLYSTVILSVFGLIIPVVMWFSRKDQSRFIDAHGKSVLNLVASLFALSILFGSALLASFIVFNINLFQEFNSNSEFHLPWMSLSIPIVLGICGFIFSIILVVLPIFGFNAANSGREFKYPLAVPFFR